MFYFVIIRKNFTIFLAGVALMPRCYLSYI